jgi:cardiolipin synthase C
MPACASNADGSPRRGMRRRCVLRILLIAASLAPVSHTCADVVRLLCDDREAAQARVDLIQLAQAEINVASFAVADDTIGRAFLALLRDAAQRGVTVRLLVDGLNNHIPDSIQRRLIASGVQLRAYHPVKCTNPLWLNRRMHDKLVIVDCMHLIVGSRNLDNRNFGLACRNYVDEDAYVRGCAAREARDYFLCVWNSDEVRPLQPEGKFGVGDLCPCIGPRKGPACPSCAMDQALQSLVECDFITLDAPTDWAAGAPEVEQVCFLKDDCGVKNQPGAISGQLHKLLSCAKQSIFIESPYLLFSKDLEAVIAKARGRGVAVTILTNSLASTDQTLVYAGYLNQRQRMLNLGVEFWEFAGPNHFHAKTVLVDGCISVVGSYNFDPRSEHLNTETAVATNDPHVADALIEAMVDHFANAWRIAPDGKPLGMNVKHPRVDLLRMQQLRAARVVAPVIKRHL